MRSLRLRRPFYMTVLCVTADLIRWDMEMMLIIIIIVIIIIVVIIITIITGVGHALLRGRPLRHARGSSSTLVDDVAAHTREISSLHHDDQ